MEGKRLGPYQVLAPLGSGGMGAVYRAEVVGEVPELDPGRAVALKVIHAHLLETEGFFRRFLREADIGRSVQHDNVVRTYLADALLHDGVQQNFLVMEYVEGQTLRDLLQELERVPEELCRHIGREVAKGLAAIHAAGVIHRDLKPENVLITPDHVVKVMDLGVARLQDEAIRLSRTGAFVGSLEYAAPEQFTGADGKADGRADLHALGVVLYELSTGHHPYRDESVSKVLRRILDEEPRKIGELNPQLSPFLEEVVHALVAKDPDRRFGAASDLAAILDEGERCTWWRTRALALRRETARPLRRIRIPRETALYGREHEVARLRAAYARTKAGEGQVLLLQGEAGIGKTRLVDELVGRLRQEGEDLNFLFGSYPPGGAATASGAFSDAYREELGAEGLEEALAKRLPQTPALVAAFAAHLRGEPVPAGSAGLTQNSLQTVFVHTTRALAAERPTVVLIDDLHFAPDEGRALFSSLALAAAGHRILLVGTTRPGIPEAWVAGITRLEHAEQIELSRLEARDLAALLTDALHSERLAHELGLKIAVKSDGNPFFVFEILRSLREGQLLTRRDDGTWITTQVIHDIEIPSSILDLVNARVADLTESERDLLDVASCLGFDFEPLHVGGVLGLGRIPALKQFQQIERRHRLVRAAGLRYVFDHHQVQEALYASLPELLRREYHTALADELEHRAVEAEPFEGAVCVRLCHHLLLGAEGARTLGYLDRAYENLYAGYRWSDAIRLCRGVLDAAEGATWLSDAVRLDVLRRLALALQVAGRHREELQVLTERLALARAVGDREALGEAAFKRGQVLRFTGAGEEARQDLALALEVATASEDVERGAVVKGQLASLSDPAGTGDQLLAVVRENQRIYRDRGNLPWTVSAVDKEARILFRRGDLHASLEAARRGVAIALEHGDPYLEGTARGTLGITLQHFGRHEEALEQYERWLALAREAGHRLAEADAAGNVAVLHEAAGRLATALEYQERSLALGRDLGEARVELAARLNLGLLHLELGCPEEARASLERALVLSRALGRPVGEGFALRRLARLAVEEGDLAAATGRARQSLGLCREIGDPTGVAESLLLLGELQWRAGEVEAARAALEETVTQWRALDRETRVAEALVLLACLPGGDAADAQAAFSQAGPSVDTPWLRYLLWRATGDRTHLAAARQGVDDVVENAPEADRESVRKNVRLNREILEAWSEHGEGVGT